MISRLIFYLFIFIYFVFFFQRNGIRFPAGMYTRLQRISRASKSREIPFSPDRDGRELRISY